MADGTLLITERFKGGVLSLKIGDDRMIFGKWDEEEALCGVHEQKRGGGSCGANSAPTAPSRRSELIPVVQIPQSRRANMSNPQSSASLAKQSPFAETPAAAIGPPR